MCIYIEPGIGAVSTQSWVNPYLAVASLAAMRAASDASRALAMATSEDPDLQLRQIGAIAGSGHGAAFTGKDCTGWCGHLTGSDYAIQGNMLISAATLDSMLLAWRNSEVMELAERLMLALEAGDQDGGDFRGKQSAALKVMHQEIYATVDVRVDEHADPVVELRRVFEVAKQQLIPFVQGMPSQFGESISLPQSVMNMLLKSPASRFKFSD